MTQPVQEPSQGRTDQAQEFRSRQLFRRPVVFHGGALIVVDFNPVGNQITVTSTNPSAATDVVTAGALTFDGLTEVKIEFYAATWDVDSRSKTLAGSNTMELYDGTTALGVIADLSVGAGGYSASICYASTVIIPSAGSHTYNLKAYKAPSGAQTPTCNIYGANVTTPHATRPGYFAILPF